MFRRKHAAFIVCARGSCSSEQEREKRARFPRCLRAIVSPALIVLTLLSAALFVSGCSTRAPTPETRYLPAGDLLDIVRDFQRLAREDTYRFTIPKDVTGVNIMKATLVRLQDYERKNPGRFSDIVKFNKALALERLREYGQAIVYFQQVADQEGSLAAEAAKNIEVLEDFSRILEKPLRAEDPFKYMEALDEKVAAWNQVIQRHRATRYEYLGREEEERIDRAKVAFVEANRYRLKDGNQLVILGYSQLVTKHRQSKNIYRFLIDFGAFYGVLAKEYASQYDPQGLVFDFGTFDQFAKAALKLYTEVAQVDGILEKIEAQGKIEAMRGFVQKVAQLNR
jgi:hypothetical protein